AGSVTVQWPWAPPVNAPKVNDENARFACATVWDAQSLGQSKSVPVVGRTARAAASHAAVTFAAVCDFGTASQYAWSFLGFLPVGVGTSAMLLPPCVEVAVSRVAGLSSFPSGSR